MGENDSAAVSAPASAVHALFDAVLAGDSDALAALLHADIEVIEPSSLPYGGCYRGKAAFLTELFPRLMGLVDIGIENIRILSGQDIAMARMDGTFTARRTGQVLRMPYVEVYEFTDGLIARITVFPSDTTVLNDFLNANS